MIVSKTPDTVEFEQGVILTIGDEQVQLVPNDGDPNVTGLPGSEGMLVIDTNTGLTYRYNPPLDAFEPAAGVSQLPFPGPTPIKIPVLSVSHNLDRVSMNSVRSIIWDVSIRNGETGAYSSYVKAMHLSEDVGYVEYSILELGTFPTYTPTLSVIADGTDMVLQYDGDAGMSASILRQQIEVENG